MNLDATHGAGLISVSTVREEKEEEEEGWVLVQRFNQATSRLNVSSAGLLRVVCVVLLTNT